jgi:hypothetical protein
MYDDIIGRMPLVEHISDRVWPGWREHLPKRVGIIDWNYTPLSQVAKQVLVMLSRKDELEKNLGEFGPALLVATMHRDVWDASKSLLA